MSEPMLPGPVPSRGWAEYAEYARRLDEVRAQENARTAGIREGVAEMSDHADELLAQLEQQNRGMTGFAQKVNFPPPPASGPHPEGHVEPQTDLARVAQLHDAAEREGTAAVERANQPNLLPRSGPGMRGFAVFGIAALVIMIVQLIGFATTNNNPGFVRYGVLVPLLGFVGALVVLRQGGRARNPDVPPPALPVRMGLLLCFGALPLLFGILVLVGR